MNEQNKLGLGRIITTPQNRDAVHIAIAPMVAAERLSPGQHVAIRDGKAATFGNDKAGAVDPYLTEDVNPGETFWLFIFPGTITGLRHEWAHPAFGPEEKAICDVEASKAWVRQYAITHRNYDDPSQAYELFMERVRDDKEIFYHGYDLHSFGDLDQPEELFHHLEVLLGYPVHSDSFTYSCSC